MNNPDKTKKKAEKLRALTDEEFVAYVENRVNKAYSEGFNKGKLLRQKDLDKLINTVMDMRDYIIDNIDTLATKLNER